MKLHNVLQRVGLTKKEADMYLALLALGESNLKDISEKADIPRTSSYTHINSLIAKGVVDLYKKRGKTIYVPRPPEKLLDTYRDNIELYKENLPRLKKLSGDAKPEPKIKVYKGQDGIKLIFNEIIQEKRPLLAITSIDDMSTIANEYFNDFIELRIKNHLPVKLLTNQSLESLNMKDKDSDALRETRFVPEKYNFNSANYIFGDKIAILSLKQTPVAGVLIEDKTIADSHRMYFDLMWSMAKK